MSGFILTVRGGGSRLSCSENWQLFRQAVAAVNTFNGEEIAGRKILVREDREDRDVKQYNKDHGIERPEGARPPRRSRRGTAQQSQEGAKLNGDHASEPLQEPSGLQVCSECPAFNRHARN